MALSLRKQRLKLAWLLVLPFFVLSRPDPTSLLLGASLALLGLALRAWAAGSILKDQALAMGGPYRFIRHPLYVGSFLLGLGVVLAGDRWPFLLFFLGFFAWAYGRTLLFERETLEERFGKEYLEYRDRVPGLIPRLRRGPKSAEPTPGFRWALYLHNKEWQAAVGSVAAFLILLIRWIAST